MNCFVFQFNSLIGKVALLLLTFVVGVASALLLQFENSPPKVVDSLPLKITLCQLAQNPENYNGKIIQVEGNAEDFDGLIHISDEGCKMVNVQWAQDKTDTQPEELLSKLDRQEGTCDKPTQNHLTGNICIADSYSSATSESARSR